MKSFIIPKFIWGKNLFKKNIYVSMSAVIFILGMIVTTLALLNRGFKPEENTSAAVRFYFLNQAGSAIESETRNFPLADQERLTGDVLTQFLKGPASPKLAKTIPDGITTVGETRLIPEPDGTGAVYELEFSPEYFEMTPVQEIFFRACFVWTMTDLDFIKGVRIYAGGQELLNSAGAPMGLLNRGSVEIHPVIAPMKTQAKTIKLYFANQTGDELSLEVRTIDVNPDNIAQFIVEQIIVGPKGTDHLPTVSADIKIRDVKTDDGICYVNLSVDFMTKSPSGTVLDKISVYSIVNSLTELSNVKKVQFLIESENVEQFKGDLDLSKQFERDESMIHA
ncbi:MAG: GerMN domain-containing protein [Clostridiales bacterium]|nr:GerMN domain-containing protein [Clostridiales bacterium]